MRANDKGIRERCGEKDRNVWTEDKEKRVLKRETKRYERKR